MTARTERDHPRRLGCEQARHQRVSEREVPHVIDAELALPSRTNPRVRAGHDACVVDQQVERAMVLAPGSCEIAHARDVGEIHRRDAHAIDTGELGLGHIRAPRGNGDFHTGAGERTHRFQTDARITTRHDRLSSAQIDALEHFVRLGFSSETRTDGLLSLCTHSSSPLHIGDPDPDSRRFIQRPRWADLRARPSRR